MYLLWHFVYTGDFYEKNYFTVLSLVKISFLDFFFLFMVEEVYNYFTHLN